MATESLLAEFPPIPTEQWERMIRDSVRGPDYPEKLIWHPEEGLAVRPYYRAEDIVSLPFLNAMPGDFPYVRGVRRKGGWRIREYIIEQDPGKANHKAIEAVSAGVEEIAFLHPRIEDDSALALLLARLNKIPVHFASVDACTLDLLINRLKKNSPSADISADLDPLLDLQVTAETIRNMPCGFRPCLIDAGEFLEHGAGAIEEVAFALSAGADVLAEMQDRELPVDSVVGAIGFSFAAGPEFFIQIAKLRAFRMNWAQVLARFGFTRDNAKTRIHARPSRWNQTVYDRHVNVLRDTTEAISAILGGADSISIEPFDECCRQPDEASVRLARNTQMILKREALLDRVADPLGGSYLIESLTNSIAARAWNLFQELEAAGGYLHARHTGVLEAVFERRLSARDESVATRRRVLIGTNRYADVSESVSESVDPASIHATPRAASSFEDLRLRVERQKRRVGYLPTIVLAEIGDVKMRSARSQFAAEYFACAGLKSEVQHFAESKQIARVNADAIVLCSSDAEYLSIAVELMPLLHVRNKPIIVVAGNPDSAEHLRALGVAGCIHLRSNVIDSLAALLRQIGIKE